MNFIAMRRLRVLAILSALGLLLTLSVGTGQAVAQESPPDNPPAANGDQARGEAALTQAKEHYAAGRWRQAAEKYGEALQYLPGNEEALDGWNKSQIMLDQGSTIDPTVADIEIQASKARTEFNENEATASTLLAQGDFNGAEQAILIAQIRLNNARSFLSESEFAGMNKRAQDLLTRIEQAREADRLRKLLEDQDDAARKQLQDRLSEQDKRADLINQNLKRVRQLQMEMRYEEALQVVQEILFIDEHHPSALIVQDALQTAILYRDYVRTQQVREHGYSQLSESNFMSTIAPVKNMAPALVPPPA